MILEIAYINQISKTQLRAIQWSSRKESRAPEGEHDHSLVLHIPFSKSRNEDEEMSLTFVPPIVAKWGPFQGHQDRFRALLSRGLPPLCGGGQKYNAMFRARKIRGLRRRAEPRKPRGNQDVVDMFRVNRSLVVSSGPMSRLSQAKNPATDSQD
jgi:hypothetical protein